MIVTESGIYLSTNEFDSLKDFSPISDVEPQESVLKIININGTRKLLKFHKNRSRLDHIRRKNLSTLISYREVLLDAIPNLVIPTSRVYVENGENIAYVMPLIEHSFCLQDLLRYDKFESKRKLKLLKKVGEILSKYGEIKGFPHKMYMGDVHEGNFLVDSNANILVVDTVSSYISGNISENGILPSKYISYNRDISTNWKYKSFLDDVMVINENTDIFCYMFMILNTIAQIEMSTQPKDRLLNYIDYLSSIGFDKRLLDAIEILFSEQNNINPKDYLMSISEEQMREAHYLVYKRKTGIDLSIRQV